MKKRDLVERLDKDICNAISEGRFEEADKIASIRQTIIESDKRDYNWLDVAQLFISVFGLLTVLHYEKLDVIGSKAFNWIKGFRL